MTYTWTLLLCINYHLRFLSKETRDFSILHYTPRTGSLCPTANVLHSHICTSCASNFRCTEMPATDEIHMEDQNQTCVSTGTFESCGTKTTDGRINLYIKLEKYKLDQIAERNIRILRRLWRKMCKGKYDISTLESVSSMFTEVSESTKQHTDNSGNHVDLWPLKICHGTV